MDFNRIWEILEQSFEENLHRSYEKEKDLLKRDDFKILTYEEDKNILGFLSYWIFKDFLYIEHFAVDKRARGKGIGKKILKEFLKSDKIKVLEVEPPNTETDKRRIKFYESFGFITNNKDYFQPPYSKNFSEVQLFIMSTKQLNDEEFYKITTQIKETVYNKLLI